MPPTQRRRDRGNDYADEIVVRLGRELRVARLAAGLSQRVVAAIAGIAQGRLSQLERGQVGSPSLRVYAVLFSVLGQKLVANAYPDGSPVRDTGHARLIARFAEALPSSVRLRTEVPLRRQGDLRAWDGELTVRRESCRLEAETAIFDIQALDRRIGLKMADDGVKRVILLVADTRRNRDALRVHRDLLRARLPLDSAEILAAFTAGQIPPMSGIVVM